MAPAVNAIAGVDDAAIAAVVASCAMFGVDWAVRQGAQALSQADIFSTVREKLVASGWSDSDFQMVANGVKHPAQGIFSLGASAFRKITEFVSCLDDEIDNSPNDSITVGNSVDKLVLGDYAVPLPPGPGTYNGHYLEDCAVIPNLQVGVVSDFRYYDNNNSLVGFYTIVSANHTYLNCMWGGFAMSCGEITSTNPANYYVDIRTGSTLRDNYYWYIRPRSDYNVNASPYSGYRFSAQNQLNNASNIESAGVALNVRKVTPDKPLPELELLPDTGEVNISTGLSFTDNNGLIDAIVNAVNGTGSYVPVYDYSQDIDDLTTASNGILGNTTGILSGVGRLENIGQGIKDLIQSIAGTLAQVLEAVISLAQTAFDFLTSLPGYLASFAGKFAGIWHYVVSWVGSLGSWITVMFSVWNGLPYAMVVPVYASAVIVLVVFVFKRFFG